MSGLREKAANEQKFKALSPFFCMKIICISDTHGREPILPDGDILIHAGDVSPRGTISQIVSFLKWFNKQPHKTKIFTVGNHDFTFETDPSVCASLIGEHAPRCIYLNDSGIEIEGLNIWGSPVSPFFFNWAFNRHRGSEIRYHWDKIPDNTDILITHGPVFECVDQTTRGESVGCIDLRDTINNRLKNLKLHVSGHIHEAYGQIEKNGVKYVNASVLNLDYQLVNQPIIVEI